MTRLIDFVKPAVITRRRGDENPIYIVVAETMQLLANKSYGYQNMEASRRSVTKYMRARTIHAELNKELFRMLDHISGQLYELELVKSRNEHEGSVSISFSIFQFAELKTFELNESFFAEFSYKYKCKQMKRDTDFFHLVLVGKNEQLYPSRKKARVGVIAKQKP